MSLLSRGQRALRILKTLRPFRRGLDFTGGFHAPALTGDSPAPNPLEQFFDANAQGPGIWKWRHYFDAYHRHFQKFIGREVHIVEVGVYSGGSLGMWQYYFGDGATVYGIDIEPACRAYETENVRIVIGDQSDRAFWKQFRREVPRVDILIDDGGHTFEQQATTFEEMLPHLAPGGVYFCEDIYGSQNPLNAYLAAMIQALNAAHAGKKEPQRVSLQPTPFQQAIHSLHLYPLCAVIEKHAAPPTVLEAPKHGTQWQPFFDRK